jgi:FtsP/CotA-like multicopper oxidase with cupredoxin domain
VDAGGGRRHLRLVSSVRHSARTRVVACVLALGVVLSAATASAGSPRTGRTIDYWVAAVPTSWNIAPNGRDAITGDQVPLTDSVMPTVVYRRYTPGWKKPMANAPKDSADGLVIPGPLIRARVGDTLRIHFKNMDTLRNAPHSMHFHGVHYEPSSDGAYVPGFSGKDANVRPGQSYTYVLEAGEDSAGVWPYHDHSASMMDSIHGGMFGMLSILGRNEQEPDHEFEVVLAPMGKFMTIDGRAFVGNTPVFKAKVGDVVQWDVMAMGSDFHTFHVHGHRWIPPGAHVAKDTQTVGPAES